jgi:allophanate hydrolase subunit 1
MVVNPASDRSVLVSFGDVISPDIHANVVGMARALQRDPIEGVLNLHPAYCSLLVVFDPLSRSHAEIERDIRQRLPDVTLDLCVGP